MDTDNYLKKIQDLNVEIKKRREGQCTNYALRGVLQS